MVVGLTLKIQWSKAACKYQFGFKLYLFAIGAGVLQVDFVLRCRPPWSFMPKAAIFGLIPFSRLSDDVQYVTVVANNHVAVFVCITG